jgi:hypothetical protein
MICWSRGADFLLERPPGNLTQIWLWMSGHGGEVNRVSRGHIHGPQDAISLRVLMGKCYALLRIRLLSIAFAEGFVVISFGKVDYDKSGWRED